MADFDPKALARVGRRVPRNVYLGDEPLFLAASEEQAAAVVERLNAALRATSSAETMREAQWKPEPWPAGCNQPEGCGRMEQCILSLGICPHEGRNLATEVHAHLKPALAAARQEGGER